MYKKRELAVGKAAQSFITVSVFPRIATSLKFPLENQAAFCRMETVNFEAIKFQCTRPRSKSLTAFFISHRLQHLFQPLILGQM